MTDASVVSMLVRQDGTPDRGLMKRDRLRKAGLYGYIRNRWPDCSGVTESLYRIYNRIDDVPACPVCGRPREFGGWNRGYMPRCRICGRDMTDPLTLSLITQKPLGKYRPLDVRHDATDRSYIWVRPGGTDPYEFRAPETEFRKGYRSSADTVRRYLDNIGEEHTAGGGFDIWLPVRGIGLSFGKGTRLDGPGVRTVVLPEKLHDMPVFMSYYIDRLCGRGTEVRWEDCDIVRIPNQIILHGFMCLSDLNASPGDTGARFGIVTDGGAIIQVIEVWKRRIRIFEKTGVIIVNEDWAAVSDFVLNGCRAGGSGRILTEINPATDDPDRLLQAGWTVKGFVRRSVWKKQGEKSGFYRGFRPLLLEYVQ